MGRQKINFEGFTLDVARHQLYRDGQRIQLGARALDLLIYLASHPAELVSKQALFDSVWGETVVTENAIARALREVRAALGDEARRPRFIETVARRGFRFIARITPGDRETPLIAVVPLINTSGNPDNAFLSDALTLELINRLARVDPSRLRVIGSSSSFHYAGSAKSAGNIAMELNADYVLSGSQHAAEGALVVSLALDRTSDRTQLWSRRFEQPWPALPTVQNVIAQHVAEALALEMIDERSRLSARPAAYSEFAKGNYYFRNWTEFGFSRALQHYETAVALDPEFSEAHAGLANALGTLAYWGLLTPGDVASSCIRHGRRALELDAHSTTAMTALGMAHLVFSQDPERAHHYLDVVAESEPVDSITSLALINLDWAEGQWQSALARARAALIGDPLSPILHSAAANSLYLGRQYRAAVEASDDALGVNEYFPTAHGVRAMSFVQLGEWEPARAAARLAREYSAHQPAMIALDGLVEGMAGNADAAQNRLEELRALEAQRPVSPTHCAWVLLALGQHDEAIAELKQAAEGGFPDLILVGVDPVYAPLHTHPEFQRVFCS